VDGGYSLAMPFPSTARSSWVAASLWAVGVVLLVAGSGVAVWKYGSRFGIGGGGGASGGAGNVSGAAAVPVRPHLVRGDDYYLHVKIIEVADRRPDGKSWDTGGSAPDLKFNLTWRKNILWESTTKPDTLIGSWDLFRIDLKQVITTGGKADLEGAINAPLIHYEPGETVKLSVWDEDTVGSDAAGDVTLRLDDLAPGEQTLTFNGGEAKAVKRVVVAMIDRNTPVSGLIEAMGKR
jgi:hypothetical protein